MTKRFDTDDQQFKMLTAIVEMNSRVAFDVAQRLADSVRPVFAVDSSGNRIEQVGSCVLLRGNQHVFAVSAAHVFELADGYVVGIGCGGIVHYLGGDGFRSLRGPSGSHSDDPIDAGVLHIADPPEIVRQSALTLDQLDPPPGQAAPEYCAAVGFRVKPSGRNESGMWMSPQDTLPTLEVHPQLYDQLGVDRQRFIVAGYDDEVFVDGRWQKSPQPKGMSGGALIRIKGMPADPSARRAPASELQPYLSGIITECRKAKGGMPQVLVAARIGFHLGLIEKYLPNAILPDPSA